MSQQNGKIGYRPPVPELGQLVYWHPNGDEKQPYPALVVRHGLDSLNLVVFEPDNYNHRCKDGVRYVGDPRTRETDRFECGCWSFRPADRELLLLKEQVAALVQKASFEHPKPSSQQDRKG